MVGTLKFKILRQAKMFPYVGQAGPSFTLTVWDTFEQALGKRRLGYALTQRNSKDESPKFIFRGENFGCPLQFASESNHTLLALLELLTCQPDAMDKSRLDAMGADQLEFATKHGEALMAVANDTFGPKLD